MKNSESSKTTSKTTTETATKREDFEHVCVIADRGWIFEGYRDPAEPGMRLDRAHVVRRWDNGLGIGGLAKAAHKDDYTLDDLGRVEVAERAVIAVIPLEW